MSFRAKRLIHELNTQLLLVEPSGGDAYFHLYLSLLTGQTTALGVDDDGLREQDFAFCVTAKSNVINANQFRLNDAPADSVAVIRILSPISKTDWCGDPGTESLGKFIGSAAANPNISSIILEIDSPGGTLAGTQSLVDQIKMAREKKPVVAFVNEGMMASAAYWIGSAATEIYASQKTDLIGSIGVYQTMVDTTERWKSMGYKIKDVYAQQSIEKNEEYREFVDKGTTKLTEAAVKIAADIFISAMRENRGSKINTKVDDPFNGRLYYAYEAQQIGLIDGIKSFDLVVQRAAELSKDFSNANNNSSNMAGLKLATTLVWISGCFGEAVPETLEEEHFQTINDKGAEQAAQLVSANTRLSEMESQLQAMTERATGAEGKVTELQGVINTYGKKPGDETTAPPKADEKIDPPAPDELSNMAHNKAVDENPFLTN